MKKAIVIEKPNHKYYYIYGNPGVLVFRKSFSHLSEHLLLIATVADNQLYRQLSIPVSSVVWLSNHVVSKTHIIR